MMTLLINKSTHLKLVIFFNYCLLGFILGLQQVFHVEDEGLQMHAGEDHE